MSDMIINDSVPVDKKWGELIRYNIFIMKLVEFVVALLLNIVPHVVEPVDVFHCLVAGPTLMLSTLIMVLYLVDQVQSEAELYYLIIELALSSMAFINLLIAAQVYGAIYGLFYIDLIIAFAMDLYYIHKERGWTF
ncbi:uncharacterized protein LOC131843852 isoform X3 [Achroia grisella]|uniref:uncharacterized protein LOC131843852 isoform X3 n=1 Tax=Achroia grisella TaxID=688607 RepID=UPI0027D26625|nr:uncharacterized protein LOC131843852 isoform X3 [Achroia grisella]